MAAGRCSNCPYMLCAGVEDCYWRRYNTQEVKPEYFVNVGWGNNCQGEKKRLRVDMKAFMDQMHYPIGEKQEIKMTRQEAIDIVQAEIMKGSQKTSNWFTNSLEALGLLKFEEDKDTIDKILQKRQQEVHGSTIRGDLYNAGYKIVRNKD